MKFTDTSGTITGTIPDDSIAEVKLDISNNPVDGQFLSYANSTSQLTYANVPEEIVSLTQTQYDALQTKDNTKLYVITGSTNQIDIHASLDTELTSLQGVDRFAVSDESEANDPTKYITRDNLANDIGRTKLSSGTSWTNQATGYVTLNLDSGKDIDNYQYITVSLWMNYDNSPKIYHTLTMLRSDIITDSTPGTGDATPSFAHGGIINANQFMIGRNSDGTTLYFGPRTSSRDTGAIVGVWGGDF